MRVSHIAPSTAGYVIAGILAACAGIELGRVIAGAPWGAFTPLASHGVAIVLSTLWIVTAIAVALRDRSRTLELVAWTTAIPAAFLLFVHGFVATWGAGAIDAGTRIALVYSGLAITLAWLLRQAFGRGVVAPVPQPVPWRTAPRVKQTFAHAR